MARSRRLSPQATAVVMALADAPATWRYGYELCRQLDLKAGSMYPILIRLADRGLLATTWESDPPPGRPPRHLYRLTAAGHALAAELEQAGARHRRLWRERARASAPEMQGDPTKGKDL
jgi:DNA-binding PadR family transcriptional regulator